LTGVDIDTDGHTEFLVMGFNASMNLVVVDFDTGLATHYEYPLGDPKEIIVGDFNGDAVADVAVYDSIRVIMKDLASDTMIGVYPNPPFTDEEIARVCLGNFSSSPGDELVVLYLYRPYSGNEKTMVETIYGNGSRIQPTPFETPQRIHGFDVTSYELEGDYNRIAATMYDYDLGETVLLVLDANLIPVKEQRDPRYLGESYVKTGHFNMDSQKDIVVVPGQWFTMWYFDGIDGNFLGASQEECVAMSPRAFATGFFDSDSHTDVSVEGPRGQFALFRGSNGETGYEDPRLPGYFEQILSYDMNGDGRDDAVLLHEQISVLISDTQPPVVTLDPLYPTHPTIYDPYLKVELTATDEMYVEQAKVYIRPAGFASGAGYLENEMTESPNGKYIFLETDLQPGDYDYYIEVVDPYLNTYSYGNDTSPYTLNVEGHFASGVHYNVTFDEAKRHILAIGNDSLGDNRIYNVVTDWNSKTATLLAFNPDFTKLGEFTLENVSTDHEFEVYTGIFDGDAILDPVLVRNNQTHVSIWVFNGDTFQSWKNATYDFIPTKREHYIVIVDDDGDGVDELSYVGQNSTGLFLVRADNDFSTWSDSVVKEWYEIIDYVPVQMYGSNPQIAILKGNNQIELFQLYNVTNIKTLNYTSPGSTLFDEPISVQTFKNSSHSSEQLLVMYRSWLIDTPTNYICLVDGTTADVGDWPSYTVTGHHIKLTWPYDVDIDGVDELSCFDDSGNVTLYELSSSISQSWTIFVSEAIPRSGAVLDFEGDGEDEFVIATSDDQLVGISFDGAIDYSATVGIAFNMAPIGNVDVGAGEDIVAFPIFRAPDTLATIRNIDLLYKLDVTFDLEASVTLQGSSLWANATVLNVYGDPVSDASVSLVATYRFGGATSDQTMGMVYDDVAELHTTTVSPNWPMGLANLSLSVIHQYYEGVVQEFENALRVESPLSITLFTESEVFQGSDLGINVTVTDSLGAKVTDADVNVTLDGVDYPVSYVIGSYFASVSNITLAPGSYWVLASADHEYATGGTSHSKSVSILASILNVTRASPAEALQDQFFSTWLNITDYYGNPIDGANVWVDFGVTEFALVEIVPGRYLLDSVAAMPVGNYTAEIIVQHDYVEGAYLDPYSMIVTGTLAPAVGYESTVVGGQNFTVSVFVYDSYGVRPEGAWAEVELGGVNHTAVHLEGAEFRVQLNASLNIGQHSLIVYVGALFGEPRADSHDLFVYSLPNTSVESSMTWEINQGDWTTLTVTVKDWSGTPVTDATVTLFSPTNALFMPVGDGTYWADLDTDWHTPWNHTVLIVVEHAYLFQDDIYHYLVVNGQAMVDVFVPDPVFNHLNTTFDFTVVDIYGNPLYEFNYSFVFAETFTRSETSYHYEVYWDFQPDVYPGVYPLNITIQGPFLIQSNLVVWVDVRGSTASSVVSPLASSTYLQGNQINFTVVVEDLAGYSITGAQVTATLRGSTYTLTEGGGGVYNRDVPTAGLPLGQYNVTVGVEHDYLTTASTSLELHIEGYAKVDLSITPSPVQNKFNVTFNFTITDQYSIPLSNFDYTLDFAGVYNKSGSSASHKFSWSVLPNFIAGNYWLNVTLNGTYIIYTTFNFSIGVQGVVAASVLAPSEGAAFTQGDNIEFSVLVQDELFNNITGATVELRVGGQTYFLFEETDGIYNGTVDATDLPIGEYLAQIIVSQAFMDTQQLAVSISLTGDTIIDVAIPSTVLNFENATFQVTVTDLGYYAVNEFDYFMNLGGFYNTSGAATFYRQTWTLVPQLVPGSYVLNVTISGTRIPTKWVTTVVEVKSETDAAVLSPIADSSHVQGTDSIAFRVELQDMLGNVMDGGSVSVLIHDSFFVLNDFANGTYGRDVSTAGWAGGDYNYTIMVSHPYLAEEATLRGNVEVLAELEFNIEYFPEEPQQGELLNITLEVTDQYGNPVPDLNITITFQGITQDAMEDSGEKGKYTVSYVVASSGFEEFPVYVVAEGPMSVPFDGATLAEVYVLVAVPEISLTVESFGLAFLIVFMISFVGMAIYFRISSGLSLTRGSQEELLKGIRRLDYLYGTIVGLAGLTILHSYLSAGAGNYALAVLESVLVLGISLILYGVWLYRDASSTILHTQRVNRRRMLFGLWHLIFVPLAIAQIFDWGFNIEWFEFYVLRETLQLGEIQVPTIVLTIFAAYVSSIIIVVVNLYREIRNGLSRVHEMAVLGTPPIVVEQECVDLVEKMGSSIRMKFFMFLVVLAGTTVLTMDFLRSYSLGVIVLMPVVFLLVIPYATSKMARGVSRASAAVRARSAEDETLSEIADEETELAPLVEDADPREEETAEPKIESEEVEDRPSTDLTKDEIIELLPDEMKELMGMEELKKLSKAQLEELLPPEEEDEEK
jgi:protocatechuate 3,4-dioxygenase beta subunit